MRLAMPDRVARNMIFHGFDKLVVSHAFETVTKLENGRPQRC